MTDRPGDEQAVLAGLEVLARLAHSMADGARSLEAAAAFTRIRDRLAQAESAIDRVDHSLFDAIDVDRSMDDLLGRITDLRAAEARLLEYKPALRDLNDAMVDLSVARAALMAALDRFEETDG